VKLPPGLLRSLERTPAPYALGGCLLLLLLLALLDRWTGWALDLSVLFLLPVSFATWLRGWRTGLAFSGLAALSWLLARTPAGLPGAHPLVTAWNALAVFGFLSFAAFSLAALRRSREREDELTRTDLLTGLLDGKGFVEQAGQQVRTALRYRRPLTLACLGVDDFNTLNARFGRDAGDAVLISIARTLKQVLRGADLVARLGGDEFGILLPETGSAQALPALRKVQTALREATEGWPITFSIGAVTCDHAPCAHGEFMSRAEDLMFEVKRDGKNDLRLEVLEAEPDTGGAER
jgi:diguanylate cyclase (GGDEF)-like protein